MKRGIILLVAMVLALGMAASASAVSGTYLSIPDIGMEESEVWSFSLELEESGQLSLHIRREVDKYTAKLLEAAAKGTHYSKATLEVCNPETEQRYLTVFLSDVMVYFYAVDIDSDQFALLAKHFDYEYHPGWDPTCEIALKSINIACTPNQFNGLTPILLDSSHDSLSPNSGTDLASVHLARDNDFLHVQMRLYDGKPSSADMSRFKVVLSRPGDAASQRQVQVVVKNNTFYPSIYLPSQNREIIYAAEWLSHGNGYIQWKVPLTDIGSLIGDTVECYVESLVDGSMVRVDAGQIMPFITAEVTN